MKSKEKNMQNQAVEITLRDKTHDILKQVSRIEDALTEIIGPQIKESEAPSRGDGSLHLLETDLFVIEARLDGVRCLMDKITAMIQGQVGGRQ